MWEYSIYEFTDEDIEDAIAALEDYAGNGEDAPYLEYNRGNTLLIRAWIAAEDRFALDANDRIDALEAAAKLREGFLPTVDHKWVRPDEEVELAIMQLEDAAYFTSTYGLNRLAFRAYLAVDHPDETPDETPLAVDALEAAQLLREGLRPVRQRRSWVWE